MLRAAQIVLIVGVLNLIGCDTPTEPTPVPALDPAPDPTPDPAAPTQACAVAGQVVWVPAGESCPAPPAPAEPEPDPAPVASLRCRAQGGGQVFGCERQPASAAAWTVVHLGDLREWMVRPGGRTQISTAGWIRADAGGAEIVIRPSTSMLAAGCEVRSGDWRVTTC